MWISLKILVLLWGVNFTPPLLSHFFEDAWGEPLDGGRLWRDGKPLFGPHKTRRGVAGSLATGAALSLLIGFPVWLGFVCSALSMAGDLASSFIKRRMDLKSGSLAPGLDQAFEGLLPFAALTPCFSLTGWQTARICLVFCIGAYVGSWFFKTILTASPFDEYPREVRSRVRLKEWRHCRFESKTLSSLLNFDRYVFYHVFLRNFFRAFGLYEKGMQNALQIGLKDVEFSFRDLPRPFDGYTILLLTDLHIDGLPGLTEKLTECIRGVSVDICILGGDFRMETFGTFANALEQLNRLIPEIKTRDGVVGVLGNHDCPEIIVPLAESGVAFLINEARPIIRDGEQIWLLGVDDPHAYKCDDLNEALNEAPQGVFTILAAHSPELHGEAASRGIRLYLCGHTHAGQVQLPVIGPVLTHARCPREISEGAWSNGEMRGYTSPGVGVSGAPVRFFSRGEATRITLRRG